MKKQIKIKDVQFGNEFTLFSNETCTRYTKTWMDTVGNPIIIANDVCFALDGNRVIVMNRDALVYIDVPEPKFEDLNVGDKFIIHGVKYIKIRSVCQERSDSYLALKLDCNTCYLISSHSPVHKID